MLACARELESAFAVGVGLVGCHPFRGTVAEWRRDIRVAIRLQGAHKTQMVEGRKRPSTCGVDDGTRTRDTQDHNLRTAQRGLPRRIQTPRPSAVAPSAANSSQRRQPPDLLTLNAPNAVNRDKRPARSSASTCRSAGQQAFIGCPSAVADHGASPRRVSGGATGQLCVIDSPW
jgi:hypothetical protein